MEEYVRRMTEAGVQEETALELARGFAEQDDMEGLERYVTACEVLAGVD